MPARTLRSVVSDAVWQWQHRHAVTLGVREQDALVDLLVEGVSDLLDDVKLAAMKETPHE
jgi:hypothetical protein